MRHCRADLLAPQNEFVAVGILENGHRAPDFVPGFLAEGDTFGLENFCGGEDIVAPEENRLELADSSFMALGCKQRDAGLRAGNQQLDPPLLLGEGLIRDHLETKLCGSQLADTAEIAVREQSECDSDTAIYSSESVAKGCAKRALKTKGASGQGTSGPEMFASVHA